MGAKHLNDDEPVEFLSTGKIAKRISKTTQTVRREIMAGRLRAKIFNGDYMISVRDYEEWKAKYFKPLG